MDHDEQGTAALVLILAAGAGGLSTSTMLTLLIVHALGTWLSDADPLTLRRPTLRPGVPASDQHHRHHEENVMA